MFSLTEVRCITAVQKLEKLVTTVIHPDGTPIKFVQYMHDSPGLKELKRKIAEAFVYALESDPAVVREFANLPAQEFYSA